MNPDIFLLVLLGLMVVEPSEGQRAKQEACEALCGGGGDGGIRSPRPRSPPRAGERSSRRSLKGFGEGPQPRQRGGWISVEDVWGPKEGGLFGRSATSRRRPGGGGSIEYGIRSRGMPIQLPGPRPNKWTVTERPQQVQGRSYSFNRYRGGVGYPGNRKEGGWGESGEETRPLRPGEGLPDGRIPYGGRMAGRSGLGYGSYGRLYGRSARRPRQKTTLFGK